MKPFFSTIAATALWLAGTLAAQAGILPGPLVDSAWLAQHQDQVQLIDVRSNVKSFTAKAEFDTVNGKQVLSEVGGHLPGARLIDMKTMRTERQFGTMKVKYMIPEQADFEQRLRAAGVMAGKPIVLIPVGVDAADIDDALRVYWQFKMYGEDDIAVLDGGTANWLIEQRATSSAPAPAMAGNWSAKGDRSARYYAGPADVQQAIDEHGAALVDARDAKHFHGLVKRDYVSAHGHVPGAKSYPAELLFKSAGGALKFLAPPTYRALFAAQGIDSAAPTVSYCNSGHLASGPWFVLSEILGARSARLFDGSMHQWTLEKRPTSGAVPLN